MSKISIIIAAYNVEKYIAQTINSAAWQTLKDIEIIVVDDCSTDGTFDIISGCAALDDRIKVIRHEENKSVNISRMDGIKAACGEYVMFIDGDDMLAPDACERAYKAIKSEKVDMLQFNIELMFDPPSGYEERVENEVRQAMHSATYKAISVSKAGVLDKNAVGDIINFTVWDKIYKRELLEKAAVYVPCEYLNMAEDVLFSFLVQFHAHSYSYITDKLYRYRFGCGMSTSAEISERVLKFIAKNAYVYDYLCEWVKSVGAETECEAALQRVHSQLYNHIAGVFFYRTSKQQKPIFISEILKYGKPSDLVLAFSSFITNNSLNPDRIARECAELDMFSAKKTQAKTIGVYYFRMYNGGIENVISSLTDIWVKAGYKVVLFTDEKPHKDDYYINPSVKRVVIPKLVTRDYFNRKKRIEEFSAAIIENDIDVMVYNAWVSPDLALDEMIIKSCGVNLIIHTHNLFCCETSNVHEPTSYFFSTLPKLYAFADSVITLTDVDTAWWQMMGLRSFKTINPIQFNMEVKPSPLNGNNILFVGRISEEKQAFDAIKIAELVRKEIPDATLTVVGKGDDPGYVDAVDNYITKNKLEDLVDMVGFKTDMLPYYSTSDVMLCTSRFEGFGLALMESKICGLPLVSYELANLDISRRSKGMAIVEQSDIRGAADAVIRILKDDSLKKELGRQARESAEEYLNVDLSRHWKNVFEQTLVPKPKTKSLYELPAAEAAARIAVEHYNSGMLKRMQTGYTNNSSPRCAELEAELENFKRSESYRVGMFITFIPRMIKALLKRILKRK